MRTTDLPLTPDDFFDLSCTQFVRLFEGCTYAWDVLRHLKPFFHKTRLGDIQGEIYPGAWVGDMVSLGRHSVVEPGAVVKGPAWIGEGCEIRASAYIRGHALIEDGAIVGNSCEIKHAWLFPHANVPHFSYVGDSVLGRSAHLGAGVKISNVKLDHQNIAVLYDGRHLQTGLRKFGAILGDDVEVGCNAVLNPGSLIGRGSLLYSNVHWRGYCPPNSVVKLVQTQHIVTKKN